MYVIGYNPALSCYIQQTIIIIKWGPKNDRYNAWSCNTLSVPCG